VRRVALSALVVLVGTAFLFWRGLLWFNMPSRARYPVRGIDVSHHQGAIDWTAIDPAEWRFAYIKATEGGDWRDPDFAANWAGARTAGLVPGAYHFFTLCRPAAEQAANFLAMLPRDRALPPAIDVELGGNCSARPDRAALLAELDVFRRAVAENTGETAILYLTREMAGLYGIDTRGAWLRDVFREPPAGWAIWQYGNHARIAGIDGRVDVDLFAGDDAAFRTYSSDPTITPSR
jgi:lysozyme